MPAFLLIDDNPADRVLVTRELERVFPRTHVHQVSSSVQFQSALEAADFDVAITDYDIRWTSGVEVLRRVKERRPSLPVIMFTGTGNEEVVAEAMKAGLDDYVVKSPRHLLRLSKAVQNCLERVQHQHDVESVQRERDRFFSMSLSLLCTLDLEGRFRQANPACEAVFGYSAAELRGRYALEFVHPNDLPAARERLERLARGEPLASLEDRWRTRDGSYRWLLFSAVPHLGEGLIYTAGQDVTEQRAAAEALDRRLRQQSAVAHLGGVAIGRPDTHAVMAAATRVACEATGSDVAGLMALAQDGQSLRLVAGHGLAPGMVGTLNVPAGLASQSGYTLTVDAPVLVTDLRSETRFVVPPLARRLGVSSISVPIPGRPRPFGVLELLRRESRAFTEDDSRFLQSLAHVVASTVENERAACALHDRQTQLALGQAVAHLGTWELMLDDLDDLERNRVLWSDEMFRLFGHAPGSFEPSFEIAARQLLPGSLPVILRELRRTVNEGVPFSLDYPIVLPDGQRRQVHGHAVLVRDASGRASRLIGTVQDMTEQVKAEAALRRSEEQLLQSQKMEAIGRLAGGVAHDFNNLLGVISGYAQMLSRELSAEHPARKRVQQIEKASERAAELTRRLLTFSRKQPVDARPIDLSALVADMEPMLRQLIGEDVRLVVASASALGSVEADPGQVEQAVMNLVVNARDAMPRGGRLTIETRGVVGAPGIPKGVELRISDTGEGMTPEVKARIFEPFFTTKEKGKGTGLGLPMVYGIVEGAGGRIDVDSEPGKGTTFRILLPRAEAPARPAEGEAPAPRAGGGAETILLVEDEAALREMVREILEENGYRVIEADCPAQARERSRAHSGEIDLVLSDVVMPGGGGQDVLQLVRARRPQARALFMSGYSDETLGQRRVPVGSRVLNKPFSTQALLSAVRDALAATL